MAAHLIDTRVLASYLLHRSPREATARAAGMSRSLNKAMLIGNVGADPEVRTTATGMRVASLPLATHRRWTDDQGQVHEKTDWHRVIAWDRLADVVERFVKRGDRLFVEGRIEYRSWEDSAGQTRYATEIIAQEVILLDGPKTEANLPV